MERWWNGWWGGWWDEADAGQATPPCTAAAGHNLIMNLVIGNPDATPTPHHSIVSHTIFPHLPGASIHCAV